MTNTQELEQRIEELEMRLSFLDDTINSLNDVITKQDKEILDLWQANRLLKESVKEAQNGRNDSFNEPPPPHY